MKVSYAICVCTEHRELDTLLCFLTRLKDTEDEIVILVDRTCVTREVQSVLNEYDDKIITFGREFENDFSAHKNYLNRKCTGDYIFNIDADEVPNENIVRNLKHGLKNGNPDLIYIPRVNICLGQTDELLKRYKFSANEVGWINWPDFQGRIYRNNKDIYWTADVHEKIGGPACKKIGNLEPKYENSLLHVKTAQKQIIQNTLYDKIIEKRLEGDQV